MTSQARRSMAFDGKLNRLSGAGAASLFLVPLISLCWRECIHFYRQRHRMLGALATPIVFWLLIGAGLGNSFHPPSSLPGITAMQFLFPGTLVLIILFTSIFSNISIIEDRREGFLQSVVVAPASRASVVLGKTLGGTLVSVIQGVLFLVLAPLVGFPVRWTSSAVLLGLIFVISFGLTALGLNIAWRMKSTQGFHAIMNLLLIPLWLLSGAFFPASGAPHLLQWLMKVNPMTYAVASLRHALIGASDPGLGDPSMRLSVIVIVVLAVFLILTGSRLASQSGGSK